MAEILCMEPDQKLLKKLCAALSAAGYTCRTADTSAQALAMAEETRFPLAVLSARLPWAESRELLNALQANSVPVLFLTKTAANAAHLRQLYRACCGVLTVPFSRKELLRSIQELTRQAEKLTSGSLCLDLSGKTAALNGEALPLTAQEFELLKVLAEAGSEPVSREQLLREAWGYQAMGQTRTVDVHVQRLRRKLGAAAIETVYRTGYRLALG